jgi:formylmethanofuran dehydrogenase subunit D
MKTAMSRLAKVGKFCNTAPGWDVMTDNENSLNPHFAEVCRMTETFVLIPGRTTDQGCGISEGKFQDKYQNEIRALQVAPGDMARLGLSDGDRVRLTGEEGQTVDVCIVSAKKDELPVGLLFIAYGDISSRMMVGDTHGSGMPTSKGMEVTMELVQKA